MIPSVRAFCFFGIGLVWRTCLLLSRVFCVCTESTMLTFKGSKPKKAVGATTLIPGQFLDRANTWEDQIRICRDNYKKDLALDFYRHRIKEANEQGSEKWGDMKLTELEKEQGGHKIGRVTDVPDVYQHQPRMYGDCKGMLVVLDTVELTMYNDHGVRPCKVTLERAERVVPDLKVTAEEMALRRRARGVLKAAASAGGEQVNVDRRSTEPPEQQYVLGQYVSLYVRTDDAGLKQVHPEQPLRYRVWKWRPLKEGEPDGEYLLLDGVENAIGSATVDLLCPITDLVPKEAESELARMVSWDALPGWSITGVQQLWKEVNRIADGKARIQQLKFVTDDAMHRELRENDGHSYVNFWVLLRERSGESQGGSLIEALQRAPMEFNGDPGAFQAALDKRMDIEKRAPWQTKLASDLLMALSAEKLQTMRAGPVKQAMQQMMATAERAFTDGDDGVTHEEIIRLVHVELGAIYRAQVARDALADLQASGTEPAKRSARWAKPSEEEEKPKPKPPTGGGGSERGGRGTGRGGRGGARGAAGRGSGGERDPMTKRVCSYEAIQKGSCPFKEECRFAHERNDEERAAMRRSRATPTEMSAHKERVKAAKEQRGARDRCAGTRRGGAGRRGATGNTRTRWQADR